MNLKPIIYPLTLLLFTHTYAEPNTPLVSINGKIITQTDYDLYLANREEPVADQKINPQVILEEIINRELLKQDALTQQLEQTPLFTQKMNQMRDNLLTTLSMHTHLEKHPIKDEDLKAEYDKRIAELEAPREYQVRHLLLKTEAEAQNILEELKKQPAHFAQMAKEKSLDTLSAKKGGELGWITKQHVATEFATAMENMSKGELTKTPIKTQFGWHIIQVDDIRKLELPNFETVKDRIKYALQTEQMQKHLRQLKESSKIEILTPPAARDIPSQPSTTAD
jgi:peptidyl-prolyl cis-trans isomerase C